MLVLQSRWGVKLINRKKFEVLSGSDCLCKKIYEQFDTLKVEIALWYGAAIPISLGFFVERGEDVWVKQTCDQKRRDKKGRILRNGESQRKDGRYAFVYTDCYGKQKFLYSWKLEPTDSLTTGCRPCLALREKEKNIQRDLHDGIVPYGGNLTVLDLVQKYIGQKKGVRHNTQANYDFVINIIKKEEFGTRRIDKIKLSMHISLLAASRWKRIQFHPAGCGNCKTCISDGS